MNWQQRYMKRFFPVELGWQDGTSEFHSLCRTTIPSSGRILEIGAGASNPTTSFLAGLGEVHGVDPDPALLQNEALTSATVLRDGHFPFPDASFDACVANYVVEHVQRPEEHLREVARVLKPGAAYLIRTPNRFHYVSAVSAWTPHWFHELVANRLRNLPAEAPEPFPTVYRMNTAGSLRKLAAEAGLRVRSLRMIEKEPSYGMSSRVLFLTFTAYERIVNANALGEHFRANIFAVLERPKDFEESWHPMGGRP